MNTVNSVAIIGAGNMGSGIAQKSAQEQFDVQMVDREKQWVDGGGGLDIRDSTHHYWPPSHYHFLCPPPDRPCQLSATQLILF